MDKFNRGEKSWGHQGGHGGGHGGFRGGFGGNKFGGGFSKGRMFPAVCSGCGNECEVPFKPTGERPVYCNQCFSDSGRGPAGPKKEFRPQHFEEKPKAAGNNEELKVQFEKLNAKMDRILKILAPVITPEAKEVRQEEMPAKEPAKKTEKKAKAKAKVEKKPAKKTKK